ncbi:MAG: DUF1850 domain-containing protein [Bosea sp. (in: a-proteobacteria)]|uniref:DUF1850 domain-containing protein n=1 Tax=Bosea sp. (in: a-proteobacteria) TaxID=1871050 RepID=UPI002734897B|nr:DUF1850 domain-containing protein [Bosea sp. (in: a-proteobacteria)]MDP3256691.1 DUF1850 domain-containing protein [Bosea sp. (in: a-proteobacteria)]MDP3320492.1 DUF1850 domain-containing protein [Bosea sp. (in: a-proteobacteria)]
MSLCLAAGALAVSLGASEITLSWRHSVQKTLWEEVWRDTPAGLVMAEARIQGSGAGMEAPPEARLADGFWRWTPQLPPQREIVMRRSGATADWQICSAGRCRPMGDYLPPEADPVILRTCP